MLPDPVPDAPPDAAPEADPDAAPDAEPEAEPDAVPDAAPDVVPVDPDVVPDPDPVVPEAEPDAEPDPEPELAPDEFPELPVSLLAHAPASPTAPAVTSGAKARRTGYLRNDLATLENKLVMVTSMRLSAMGMKKSHVKSRKRAQSAHKVAVPE